MAEPTYFCCPFATQNTTGGCSAGGSALVEVANDVWDGFAGVWPLDEEGDGSTDEFQDRSRSNLHGTGGDGSDLSLVPTRDSGVYCQFSQHFVQRQYITLPPDNIPMDQGFSVSLWGKINTYNVPRCFFSRGHTTTSGDEWAFSLGYTFLNQIEARVQILGLDGAAKTYSAVGSTWLSEDQWYHLAASWEPGIGLKLYLNGEQDGQKSVPESLLQPVSSESYFGRWNDGSHLTGNLQDVRLHPVVRSEAWFAAEYQSYCGSFLTVG